MKRVYVVQIGHMESERVQVLTRLKIAAISVEQALDRAQTRSEALRRAHTLPGHLNANYLLCSGYFRRMN